MKDREIVTALPSRCASLANLGTWGRNSPSAIVTSGNPENNYCAAGAADGPGDSTSEFLKQIMNHSRLSCVYKSDFTSTGRPLV
jgi:hypothetical protein